MKNNILPGIKLTLVCLIFFSGIYTISIFGIAQLAPNHGEGEIITHNGNTYYKNIGQTFTDDKYFNSRPSAVNCNAAGSGGSNKGPSNPDYLGEVKSRIDTFLLHNPTIQKSEIPAELITASGSGLDPHISVASAKVQVPRIAAIRTIAESKILTLIQSYSEQPLLGMFGTERVNVLMLNIALDNLEPSTK